MLDSTFYGVLIPTRCSSQYFDVWDCHADLQHSLNVSLISEVVLPDKQSVRVCRVLKK